MSENRDAGSENHQRSPIASGSSRKLVVGFFALVGFAASLVTVLDYMRPAEVSALNVKLSVYPFRTPDFAGKDLQSTQPARQLASKIRNLGCEEIDTEDVYRLSRSELAKIEDSQERKDKLECYDAISVEFAARWNGEFSESDNILLEYIIANIGQKTAEDIRIQGKNLNSLQYQSGSSFVDVKKTEKDEFFDIPKLNPGESVRVLAWSDNYFTTWSTPTGITIQSLPLQVRRFTLN